MGDIVTVVALIALIAASVAVPLAIAESAERLGDELSGRYDDENDED